MVPTGFFGFQSLPRSRGSGYWGNPLRDFEDDEFQSLPRSRGSGYEVGCQLIPLCFLGSNLCREAVALATMNVSITSPSHGSFQSLPRSRGSGYIEHQSPRLAIG